MCECVQAWGHWSIMNEDYQNSRVRLMRVQQTFPHLTCAVILGYLLNLFEHQLPTIFLNGIKSHFLPPESCKD